MNDPDYNQDGYYIQDRRKWEYYAKRPKLYRRRKIFAYLYLLIPISGIVGTYMIFEDMGLCIFLTKE